MKMTKAREVLTQHIKPTREAFASVALAEVAAAEDLAAMLRELCEEHWTDSHDRMRAAVRKAEALLAKVGG